MRENEEEQMSLLTKVKDESEGAGLKLNIQKTKIKAYSPLTSWQIEGKHVEAVTDFLFLENHFFIRKSFNLSVNNLLSLRRFLHHILIKPDPFLLCLSSRCGVTQSKGTL